MRFGRDKLIFMGLVALDEAAHQVRTVPIAPNFGLRVTLAMLFSLSNGDRSSFNLFWEACQRPPDPLRWHQDTTLRQNDLHRSLAGICRALGWSLSINLGDDIACAQREPTPQHRAWDDRRRQGMSDRDRARQAFAEWLRTKDGLGESSD